MKLVRILALTFALLALGGMSAACSRKAAKPAPNAHDTVLSITAEFQLLTSGDPYRDPVGRDLGGLAIPRATLVRASNYQALYPGRFSPELLMLKGRALEWMGDYRSARRNYEESAEFETELRDECRRRIANLDLLLLAAELPNPDETLEGAATHLDLMATEFRRLSGTFTDPFYQSLALREVELTEINRCEVFITGRRLLPNGEDQAREALEKLVASHRESARAYEHALRLAHFHVELAREEARLNHPSGPNFNQARFQRHFDAAADLLYRISQADGFLEREPARLELDALLAYGEVIRGESR